MVPEWDPAPALVELHRAVERLYADVTPVRKLRADRRVAERAVAGKATLWLLDTRRAYGDLPGLVRSARKLRERYSAGEAAKRLSGSLAKRLPAAAGAAVVWEPLEAAAVTAAGSAAAWSGPARKQSGEPNAEDAQAAFERLFPELRRSVFDSLIEARLNHLRAIVDAVMKVADPSSGIPIETLVDYVVRVERGITRQRAATIAVTETARVWNTVVHAVFEQNGVAAHRWLTTGDERVCPICIANAAQGAIPVARAFRSGDRFPPAHPLCRCDVVPGRLAPPRTVRRTARGAAVRRYLE